MVYRNGASNAQPSAGVAMTPMYNAQLTDNDDEDYMNLQESRA